MKVVVGTESRSEWCEPLMRLFGALAHLSPSALEALETLLTPLGAHAARPADGTHTGLRQNTKNKERETTPSKSTFKKAEREEIALISFNG